MSALEWIMGFLGFAVIVGAAVGFWRGLSLRPHRPDQSRAPERWSQWW